MHSYLYKYLGMLHTDTILLYKQGGLAKMQITLRSSITILHIFADIYVQSIYIGIPVATLDVVF